MEYWNIGILNELFQSLKLWKSYWLLLFLFPNLLFSQETDSTQIGLGKKKDKFGLSDSAQTIRNLSDTTQAALSSAKKITNDSLRTQSSVEKKTYAKKFYWNDRKINADTALVKKYHHRPMYAALFSAALPGLGQAYNRKYWKIPIVYAGFGGLGYALYYTSANFNGYRHAYRLQVDNNPNTYGSYKGVDDIDALKDYRDYYKKDLDISAICTAVWYILNIVDATVDAHLFEWSMKDDLSVSWQPTMISSAYSNTQSAAGVKVTLNF